MDEGVCDSVEHGGHANPQRPTVSERCLRISAGLARRAQPGHRPARGDPQPLAVAGEPLPVGRRRLADDLPERAAERARGSPTPRRSRSRSPGGRSRAAAPSPARPAGAAGIGAGVSPNVARNWRLKWAGETCATRASPGTSSGSANIAVHRVAGSEHPPVAVLDRARHGPQATCAVRLVGCCRHRSGVKQWICRFVASCGTASSWRGSPPIRSSCARRAGATRRRCCSCPGSWPATSRWPRCAGWLRRRGSRDRERPGSG